MKDRNEILKYYSDKLKTFYSFLKGTLKKENKEAIHQLRVTVKELRAIWRMIELISEKEFINNLEPHIGKLFKRAGRVREAQINLSLVKKNTSQYLRPYIKSEQNREKNQQLKLKNLVAAFDKEIFDKENSILCQALSKILLPQLKHGAIALIIQKNEIILDLKKALPDDRKLHKIRIHLKVIKEVLNLLHQLNLDSDFQRLRIANREVCKCIGTWHDYVVLRSSLLKHDISKMNNHSIFYYKKYIERTDKIQEDMQEEVIIKLENYIKAYNELCALKNTAKVETNVY